MEIDIIVISLADATERRESIAKQLRQFGFKFSFFDAIDGRGKQPQDFEEYDKQNFLYNYGRPASAGEIGCYLSHLALWRYCEQLNKTLLILEDDAIIEENFIDSLALLNEAKNLNFVRLQKCDRSSKYYSVCTDGKLSIVKYIKSPQGLLGYLIRPSCAKALVEAGSRIRYPVDVFVRKFWQHKQPIYGLKPPVVRGSVFPTMIGDDGRERGYRKSLSTRAIILRRKIRAVLGNAYTNMQHLKAKA